MNFCIKAISRNVFKRIKAKDDNKPLVYITSFKKLEKLNTTVNLYN